MNYPPRWIGIYMTGHWDNWWRAEPDGDDEGVVRFKRTTHAYARGHKAECVWLSPMCGECAPPIGSPSWDDDYSYCQDEHALDQCEDDGCNKGPTPYRMVPGAG